MPEAAPKIRVLKVAVKPYIVFDYGDRLEEIDHPVTEIPGDEWPTYSSDRFPREVEEWQAKLDEEARTPEKVKQERAQRKKKPVKPKRK